jgi:thioredoxin-dependent peroxiredoxin
MSPLLKRFAIAGVAVVVLLGGWIAYVRATAPQPATDTAHIHASSEDHKECAARVANKPLPRLDLRAADGALVNAAELSQQQPVIMIHFMGNTCSHCIEQLVALNKRSAELKSRGIRVIAFSEDSAEDNAATVSKYTFDASVFTFTSDPVGVAARALGAFYTERDGTETELHIALVVKRGTVTFAHFDTKPLMDITELIRLATTAQPAL